MPLHPWHHAEVVTSEYSAIQRTVCKTAAFIADCASVTFTVAFLRWMVFYYQFDRDSYCGGAHN